MSLVPRNLITGKPETLPDQTALQAMSEAHDAKDWARVLVVGDAWRDARNGMAPVAAIWYAQALMASGRAEEAVPWASAAVKQLPEIELIGRVAALGNLAAAYSRVGKFRMARKAMQEMVNIDVTAVEDAHRTPAVLEGIADALEKQGHVKLALSEKYWNRAWQQMESRLTIAGRGLPSELRQWDGKEQCRVAVIHEQGLGDGILFARWIPTIQAITGQPVKWYGPKALERWMSDVPHLEIGDQTAMNPADFDAAVMLMSLPAVLGCDSPSAIPAPYAPSWVAGKRATRTGSTFRVGLCWKGNTGGWHDFERSYSLDQFAPMWAEWPTVEFVNLQHDVEVPDNAPFATVRFQDLVDTAELLATCDVVVSVDTSIVHLAGSCGIPTLALLPTVTDWRYRWPHAGGSDFYPSVTAIRRKTSVDLSALVLARTLIEHMAERIPV